MSNEEDGRLNTETGAPRGAVNAIRTARSWPAFEANRRTTFWINALLTVVAVAASYGAALGQAGFAEMYLGMHGPERYVVFLIIEATAVALMLLANQTALAGDSAGGLWTLVWAVTAGAVTMQVVHANAIGQPEAAMVYATASVLTVVLWRAKTRRSLRDRLRAAGMIEDPLPRYRPVRWVLRPRETFQAWYLALGEGVSDPATAMDMSRADRLYHRAAAASRADDRKRRRERQPLRDLTGQGHVVPPWRVTHPDAARFGVLPWHRHELAAIAPAETAVEVAQTVDSTESAASVVAQVPPQAAVVGALDVERVDRPAVGVATVPGREILPIGEVMAQVRQQLPVQPQFLARREEIPAGGPRAVEVGSAVRSAAVPQAILPVSVSAVPVSGAPVGGSIRMQVPRILDGMVRYGDDMAPAGLTDLVLGVLPEANRSSVIRYVGEWIREVRDGKRQLQAGPRLKLLVTSPNTDEQE